MSVPVSGDIQMFFSSSQEFAYCSWYTQPSRLNSISNSAAGGNATSVSVFTGQNGPFPTQICRTTEEFNGTSWSNTNPTSKARTCGAGTGTQNSALIFGGRTTASPGYVGDTEEYNGTSWVTCAQLSFNYTCGVNQMAFGTQNATIGVGGTACMQNCSFFYNGTAWSLGTVLPSGGCVKSAGAFGNCNDGMIFGGCLGFGFGYSYSDKSFCYGIGVNSWSTSANMITPRAGLVGNGLVNGGLATGGYNGSNNVLGCTEMWTGTSWEAGGNLILPRDAGAGHSASSNRAVIVGGILGNGSVTNTMECYNWDECYLVTIEGAVAAGPNVATTPYTENFNTVIACSRAGGYCTLYSGTITNPPTQVSSSLQFKGYTP